MRRVFHHLIRITGISNDCITQAFSTTPARQYRPRVDRTINTDACHSYSRGGSRIEIHPVSVQATGPVGPLDPIFFQAILGVHRASSRHSCSPTTLPAV